MTHIISPRLLLIALSLGLLLAAAAPVLTSDGRWQPVRF